MKDKRIYYRTVATLLLAVSTLTSLLVPLDNVYAASGKALVESACSACHLAGVLNAPKLGSSEDWKSRLEKGEQVLMDHAINGFQAMPAKGGNAALSDTEVTEAVRHMLALAGKQAVVDNAKAPKGNGRLTSVATKVQSGKNAEQKDKATGSVRDASVVEQQTPVKKAQITQASKPSVKRSSSRRVNAFNRLMKPPSKRNPPPPKDGIHDPKSDGTHALQHPQEAFRPMAKSNSGNRVDWVKSLADGTIAPRYDRLDANRQPVVLDLNIVREVKGSMPNVVYPHKQHTEWLDCSNCHPSIFLPKKGANNISMASIMLGESCGVCHGKVAFPVAECRKCHSQRKTK